MAKRYSQPQIGTPIDWGNPRAKGLVYAWVPAISQLTKFGAVGRDVNRQGVGSSTNGSSTYEFMNSAPVFSLDECSLTAILTPQNITTASAYAVACGQNASANPLFMIGQGATSNQLGFRTRDSANTDVLSAGASADWANGVTTVVSGTRSKTAALQRVFAAGKQVASAAVGTAAATTFDRFSIGCLLRSSAALYWSGTTNLVLIHNRALTNDDEEELADNPWQVWVPTNRQFFVSSGGGGAGNATGSLASITIDAATGTATGKATATAALASVTLSPVTGTASSSSAGSATGTPAAVTLTPATGTATGKATATTAPAAVTITAATGTASATGGGAGNAFAAFMAVVLTPATGLGAGKATALCSLPALTLVPATGSATSGTVSPPVVEADRFDYRAALRVPPAHRQDIAIARMGQRMTRRFRW